MNSSDRRSSSDGADGRLHIRDIKVLQTLKMADVKHVEVFIIFIVTLLQGSVVALNCTSPTPDSLFEELEKKVFPKTLVRPVNNFSSPISITISITVAGILGVDEKSQTLTTVLWQVLEWNIAGLSWDKEECGADRVSVPREKLWVPDITISELIDVDRPPNTPYVYLDSTGHVYDDRPVKVVTSCQMGIYTFPFDIQNCTLTFGSYLHFATDIRMIQGVTEEEMFDESKDVLKTKGEWELISINVDQSRLELSVGSYSEITYFLSLRRRPLLYVVNLLIPSCFLIAVDLFSFFLPPAGVDRSSFKMTLILGYTVFLLIMNDLLPITGETTPLINVFFSISLALMVASLLETVFITSIQFSSSQYSAVPHWLSVLVLRYLAVVVCLPPKKKSNRVTVFFNPRVKDPETDTSSSVSGGQHQKMPDDPIKPPAVTPGPPEPSLEELRKLSRDLTAIRLQVDKYFRGSDTAQEWQMIGIVIDRLLFGLYILFIVASFITIISIWTWNNNYAA